MDDKERLMKILETKMKTIMVGSLCIIEEELCDMFGIEKDDLINNEKISDIYSNIRKRIFDNGNNQIKLAKDIIKNYQIKSNKITLPVIGMGNYNGKD